MNRLPGIKYGLIGGVCLVLLSMIGMVEAFNQREIVSEVISMGQMLRPSSPTCPPRAPAAAPRAWRLPYLPA
jgi:hypothetical protein